MTTEHSVTLRELTEVVSGLHYAEGPRWHDGRLYLSDFYGYQVLAVRLGAGGMPAEIEKLADVPHQPSGLGWLPDSRLLIVSMKDRTLLVREHDGALRVHADLSSFTDYPLNDMVVDARGNAYIGSFGFDIFSPDPARLADIYRVDVSGKASVAATGLYAPNGMVVTPGGSSLIVNETIGNRISVFAIGLDGELGERRDWATFGPTPELAPVPAMFGAVEIALDGNALDAQGAVWTADAAHGRVLRVAEGGQILDEITLDGTGAYACALGGDDGHTLFICSAPDFSQDARKAAAESRVLATRVDVPA
jgi:sugar lactone lactonase YvrE